MRPLRTIEQILNASTREQIALCIFDHGGVCTNTLLHNQVGTSERNIRKMTLRMKKREYLKKESKGYSLTSKGIKNYLKWN